MNSLFDLEEKFEKSWTKKMDAEDEILMVGYLLMRKRRNNQQQKTAVRKIFLLCNSLSLDVPLFCLFINDPFLTVLTRSKVYQNFVF